MKKTKIELQADILIMIKDRTASDFVKKFCCSLRGNWEEES